MSSSAKPPADGPSNPSLANLRNTLLLLAAGKGVPLQGVLERFSLDRLEILRAEGPTSEKVIRETLLLLERLSPDDVVVLELARLVPVTTFGPIGWMVRRSPTLGELLTLVEDQADLLSGRMEICCRPCSEGVWFQVRHPFHEQEGGVGAVLAVAVGRVLMERHFGGGPVRVELRGQATGPLAVYEDFFGCSVHFGMPEDRMLVSQESLALSNLDFQPRAVALAHEAELLRREHGVSGPDPLADVRSAIARGADVGEFGATELARRLGTSVRSLQRRLKAAGTNAQALLDDARHHRALELLGRPELSVAQVADELGFRSERGFRKAFTRWAGVSPAQARREGSS